ncbi:MAG: hypothetical protein ACLGIV_08920 [Actinomycetes bacterium]
MPFVPYARTPGRAVLQVLVDVLVVVWVWVWVRAGLAVRDATLALAQPGLQLEAGAQDVAGSLADAGGVAGGVPLVGDELAGPFVSAGEAASAIAAAGRRQAEVVQDLSVLLGVVVAAVPVLVVVGVWLPLRVRFTRRASAAQRLVDSGADLDLFALRALANQPMHRLARVSDDPVRAWREGDARTVRALAVLELADAGLRPPPLAGSTP